MLYVSWCVCVHVHVAVLPIGFTRFLTMSNISIGECPQKLSTLILNPSVDRSLFKVPPLKIFYERTYFDAISVINGRFLLQENT